MSLRQVPARLTSTHCRHRTQIYQTPTDCSVALKQKRKAEEYNRAVSVALSVSVALAAAAGFERHI